MHTVAPVIQIILILKYNTRGLSIDYACIVHGLPISVYEQHAQVLAPRCLRPTETARAGAIQAGTLLHVIGFTFMWDMHSCLVAVYMLPSMFDWIDRRACQFM